MNLKKKIIGFMLSSLLLTNTSCYFMGYEFDKDRLKDKEKQSEVTFENYDLKIINTKIDAVNKKMTGKVQFVPEYQEKSTKIEKSSSNGDIVFWAISLIKVPLFLASIYFLGTEANKGNVNIPLAAISSLFALDFASWGIISASKVPAVGDYHLKEEVIPRDDLKTNKYENLIYGSVKITCDKSLYNFYTDEQGLIEINAEDMKAFTKNNLFNQDCYVSKAKVILKDKKELEIKMDLKLFSFLPLDYLNVFPEYQKKN